MDFLTDFTALLNELNLEVQGKENNVVNINTFANTFKRKLQLLSTKLHCHDLHYFQHMNSELVFQRKTTSQFNSARYTKQVQSLSSEFGKRFIDCASVKPIVIHMCFPFVTDINVDIASKIGVLYQLDITAVENEMLSLQNDIEMKSRASTERKKIWKLLLEEKCDNIKRCAFYILSCFESTYLCESVFSHTKMIKCKYRPVMIDQHLLA